MLHCTALRDAAHAAGACTDNPCQPPRPTERALLPAYLPVSEASSAIMRELLLYVAGDAHRITHKELPFLGRSLVLPEYANRCAKVSFRALCGEVSGEGRGLVLCAATQLIAHCLSRLYHPPPIPHPATS